MARGGSATAATRTMPGKKSTRSTPGNKTPNTPTIRESELRQLTVDVLRERLKKLGVGGISALRKPELVSRLAASLRRQARTESKAKPASKPKAEDKAKPKGATAGDRADRSRARPATASRARQATASRARPATATGSQTSRTLKYSQEIASVSDKPERRGRSLRTTNHDVIKRWAQDRKAVPATVGGTEHGDHLGVLRFDFPGWGGATLRKVSWDEWFHTFDARNLNFIYQEQRTDGRQSNFFRLESPEREDA